MTTRTVDVPDSAPPRSDSVPHYRMFIGGEWVDGDEHDEIRSPATEELVATVARGNVEHLEQAVAAAKAAHESGVWRLTPPAQRSAVLRDVVGRLTARMNELVVLQARENGAPVRLAAAFHVGAPIVHLNYFADLALKYEFERHGPDLCPVRAAGTVRREPIGVCGAIVAWNIPLLLGVWKVGAALAAGNTVVLKPDEKAPLLLLELAREFDAAGLPPGVFNVVTGEGETVGARLAGHPDVRKIAFTGSTAVGREVMRAAASNVKRVTLELGGKGPNIVLADADLDTAVDGSLFAYLAFSGQGCESGTRLLLPDSIHDEFVSRMVARIATLKIGDPLDPATDMGPVVSAEQRDRIIGYIESAKAQGATVACGGGVPSGPGFERGHWVEPTIVTGVTNDMQIAREEVFGPVVAVIRYETLGDAIAIANDSDYGLSAGVWSTDADAALGVAGRLDAGMVWINDWHVGSPDYPFGGCKQSGVGREMGPNALDEYTEEKFISVDRSGGVEGKLYGLLLSTPAGAPAAEGTGESS